MSISLWFKFTCVILPSSFHTAFPLPALQVAVVPTVNGERSVERDSPKSSAYIGRQPLESMSLMQQTCSIHFSMYSSSVIVVSYCLAGGRGPDRD